MATRRHDETPVEELSDRQLRSALKKANQTVAAIDGLDPAEVVRSGQAAQTLARYEAAVTTAEDAGEELRQRRHKSLPERLRLGKALRDAKHEPHPAKAWLEEARKYSVPELAGETLVADRLSEEDTVALERVVRRKREIAGDPQAAALTPEEVADWERVLGLAAGDENMFERKRKEAAVKTKLDSLKDARKVASLPRQPLLAEAGSVQLPRYCVHDWLLDAGARKGDWTLIEVGLLAGLLGAFANRDAKLVVGGRFEEDDAGLTLVAPAGVGSDLRLFGRVAGSPLEDGSGHVRVKPALSVLQHQGWFEVEQTVGELRIRLGDRALKMNKQPAFAPDL